MALGSVRNDKEQLGEVMVKLSGNPERVRFNNCIGNSAEQARKLNAGNYIDGLPSNQLVQHYPVYIAK